MKFNLGLRPYDKVVYDRNLQAIVDKIFPDFALQVLLNDDWSSWTLFYTANGLSIPNYPASAKWLGQVIRGTI